MSKNKIVFLKSLSLIDKSFVFKVQNDPKYDMNPLINEDTIDEAIKEYGKNQSFSKEENFGPIPKIGKNIEGKLKCT